jgi:hypothetical protein
VLLPPGHAPDEPAVDGAESQFAVLSPFTGPVYVIEDPLNLGAGKVGVENQAGFFLEEVQVPLVLESVAKARRAPILPDDGVVDGSPGFAVPDDCRLALVGNTDGGEARGSHARSAEGL